VTEYQGFVPVGSAAPETRRSLSATVRPFGAAGSHIEPAAVGVVAFVGRCMKGPIHEPVQVGSYGEFQQKFGGLWLHSTLPHAVEQFFEHGGQHALIVRVVSGGRAPTIDLPAGGERLMLVGLCPGSQEFLRVSVDHDGIGMHDPDLFNLVVQRVRERGSELVEAQEIFRRVSILGGSARDVRRMLTTSVLVRVAGSLPSRRPDITRGDDPRALIGYADCNHDGDDGQALSDYDLIGSEAQRTGLFALQQGPAFNFLYLPPPAQDRDLGMSALVVAARFCRRHHAMLLVDPPHAWRSVQEALDGLDNWPFHSADALMFFPRLLAMDRLRGRMSTFPPSAAAVGALVREAGAAEVWQEQAEPPLLRPSATPQVWVDRQQRTRLAQRGVNALQATRLPARDAVSLRSLAGELGNGADARVLGARRLALLASASIERGTHWVSIEGNTPRSRERVCRQVDQFLRQLAEAGAFAGTERNRHYFVLCDERLNGAAEQASGVFRMLYGFQSAHATTCQSWLVEHRAGGSYTRPASVNQLAALELNLG
jgi:uncharacterized protein